MHVGVQIFKCQYKETGLVWYSTNQPGSERSPIKWLNIEIAYEFQVHTVGISYVICLP